MSRNAPQIHVLMAYVEIMSIFSIVLALKALQVHIAMNQLTFAKAIHVEPMVHAEMIL